MNCKFCGAELKDDAVFCTNCGKTLNEEAPAAVETAEIPVAPAAPVAKAKKFDIINLVPLVVGTLFIIIGLIRLAGSSVSVSSTSFGADFYTYSYRGIVACAKMLAKINASVSWLIIAVGASIDLKALKGLLKK